MNTCCVHFSQLIAHNCTISKIYIANFLNLNNSITYMLLAVRFLDYQYIINSNVT